MTGSFDETAQIVASKLSSLLQTSVLIKDSQQAVVVEERLNKEAESLKKNGTGYPSQDDAETYLKLPFYIHDQVGEIQICQNIDGEQLTPKLAQAFVDLVISRISQSTGFDQQNFKNRIISDLLKHRIAGEEEAQQQANRLGIDFTPPRAVILVDATEYMHSLGETSAQGEYDRQQYSRSIIHSIVHFFNLPDDTICADLGGGEFAVLKASDTKNLSPWAGNGHSSSELKASSWMNLEALKRAGQALLAQLRQETGAALSIGIGRYHPGILGLARSYEDARAALRLGRQFNGPNQVYCLDHLGIAAFACVADERTKIELALHLLSPLDNEPELINTLRVFFTENCAFSMTAKRLCIHRNTLTYRLEKITSLTGLDPRRFDEAVQIRLALLLKEFQD